MLVPRRQLLSNTLCHVAKHSFYSRRRRKKHCLTPYPCSNSNHCIRKIISLLRSILISFPSRDLSSTYRLSSYRTLLLVLNEEKRSKIVYSCNVAMISWILPSTYESEIFSSFFALFGIRKITNNIYFSYHRLLSIIL